MVVVMADVDITSLSVEISAESQGAELNIDKLAAAISNLRTKGNVTKVVNSLDKLSSSIATLKQASAGMSGLDKITSFLNGLSNVNTTASAKSINTVVNAIKKIPAAVSGLNGVDFYSMSGSITQLTNALAPLSILDASNLKALGSAFNAIGKVPDLTDKLKATDLDSFTISCQKISTALTPLASQLDKVGNAFAKLPPQLSKVVTQANRVTAANEKQRKSYLSLSNQMNGFMRNMAKLVSLKAIADYLGNAVAKFNDFYEAANMFGVSMGDMTNEASSFIDKMEQLLGIDPSEAMNAMANIYSMTKSFGLAKDQAYTLSKSLTQLGYDLSSLKNIPISQAFTKIRSAMAGELEPMLQLGVDISQARLQQELLELGFNKQVSTLSQADKATLRYIAILKQTTDAQGDFARTLSSPANMIRILKAQLSGLARDIGSLLYPALKSILPPLIAAVQLIREFVEWVAKLMGVKVVFTDFTKSTDSVGGIGDAMDDTADSTKKAAKALKDYTMGFDELNIIDPTQGSSGSGSGASAGNILGDVDLSGYDMFKNYVGNAVDEIKAKLEKLAPLIAGISAGFATWAIGNALLEALNKIKGDGSLIEGILKLWKSPIMGAAVAVGIMVARFVDLYQNSEAFRKGLERVQAMIYLAAEGLRQGWNISLTDGKLGESIKYLKESFFNLKQVIWNLIPESWQEGISSAFKTISDAVKDLDLDVGDLITTLMGIGLIVSGHPVAGLAVLGFEAITVAVRGLGSESQKEAFEMETDWFNAFKSMGEKVADFVGDAITAIGNLINDFAIFIGWIQNGVSETDRLDLQMNGNFIENAVMGIAQLIHDIGVFVGWITNGVSETDRLDIQMNGNFIEKAVLGFADLINWVKNVVTWFVYLDEHVENGARAVRGFIDDIKTWAKDAAKAASDMVTAVANAIASLPSKMSEAGKNIWQGLVNGIKSGIETAKGAAANLAKAIIDKFTNDTEIHSPSALFERFGEFIDQGLANGITAALPYVEQAMTNLANVVQQKGNEMIDYGATTATNFVNGFFNGLDSKWQELDSGLQNDFFGTVQNLWNAVQNGDLKTIGTTAAAIIWQAMGEENQNQVKAYAQSFISNIAGILKDASKTLFDEALKAGKAIWSGITNNFGNIIKSVSNLGTTISASISALKVPLATTGTAISQGLFGGLVSSFPNIFAAMGGLIGTVGSAFVGLLDSIAAALTSTVFGIPVALIVGAAAIALGATIAGIVSNLGGKYSTSNSSYVGTPEYNASTGSTTSSGGYYSNASSGATSSSDLQGAVYNGCYNAFLDIFQRYGDEITGGKEVKLFIDGKQITASVEKQQADRGVQIMGTEVYSY
nr:MAG TPA: minor tail protein [Caudoviricetes sp.]